MQVPMTLTAIVIHDWEEDGIELIFDNEVKCVAHVFLNKSDVTIAGTNSVAVPKYDCRVFTEGNRYIGLFSSGELYNIKNAIDIVIVQ